MKKTYDEPMARIIELQMNESIAGTSGGGETEEEITKITGNWDFNVEVEGKCYEKVKGDYASGYDGMGITSAQALRDAGFLSWYYYEQLKKS